MYCLPCIKTVSFDKWTSRRWLHGVLTAAIKTMLCGEIGSFGCIRVETPVLLKMIDFILLRLHQWLLAWWVYRQKNNIFSVCLGISISCFFVPWIFALLKIQNIKRRLHYRPHGLVRPLLWSRNSFLHTGENQLKCLPSFPLWNDWKELEIEFHICGVKLNFCEIIAMTSLLIGNLTQIFVLSCLAKNLFWR